MAAVHVIVVGAGPAGAALAFLLARRGIETTLLERQSDFAREFRGEGLMPSGQDAIRQMGLGARLDALPSAHVRELHLYQGATRRLVLPVVQDGVGPRFVSQPALLEMLVEEAAASPRFRLERGFTARDLLRDGERVTGVRGDGPDGPREIRGSLVIGADGRASLVRKRSGLDRPTAPEAFDVVWCRVPMAEGFREAVRMYLSRGHFCIAFRTHDDRIQIGWVIAKGEFGELRRRGVPAWLGELAQCVSPDLASHLRAHRHDPIEPFLLDVVCHHLIEWSAPGALLIGDAAHPMSPVGAQGINVALRDAIVAANHLVPLLRGGGTPLEITAASRRVRDERLPEVKVIQSLQRLLPRILFQRTPWSRFAIARVAPLLSRVGLLRLLAGAGARRFTEGATRVELRV